MSRYIPAWDSLRAFLTDGGITQNDISQLLRKKGVYLVDSDKDISIPWLALGGLSTSDITYLVAKVRSREERMKQGSHLIPTSQASTFDAVSEMLLDLAIEDFVTTDGLEKVQFLQRPRVVRDSSDGSIHIPYRVLKREYTNTFAAFENEYAGEVYIRGGSDGALQVTTKYSCKENSNINKRIISCIDKALVDHGLKSRTTPSQYLVFNGFTNAERFELFSQFVDAHSPFSPKGLHFIGISPDRSMKIPDALAVLVDEVTRLGLNGEFLEMGKLWTEEQYHEFLLLFRVDVLFNYDNGQITGEALGRFWFPDYSKSQSLESEFESICAYAKATSGKLPHVKQIEADFELMARDIESRSISSQFDE